MSWEPHKTDWWLDGTGATATVRDGSRAAIARCYRGDVDGRRIAATPDLLNALHEAGDVIEAQLVSGEVTPEGWNDVLDQIVRALRKAGDA